MKNIHAFLIPSDDWDGKPIIQVNEVNNVPGQYGGNESTTDYQKIQVQVYYPSAYLGDMEATENSIKAVMQENSYRVYENGDHVATPDGNILITIKFNYEKRKY